MLPVSSGLVTTMWLPSGLRGADSQLQPVRERVPGAMSSPCGSCGHRVVGSGAVAYMRTVKTASGRGRCRSCTAHGVGARRVEHLGSAHDDQELEALKAAARQRLAGGQGELGLGLATVAASGSAPLTSSQMGHLSGVGHGPRGARVRSGCRRGRGVRAAGVGRIIEPISKADSLRVLAEVGIEAVSYPTLNRRLPAYATEKFRQKLVAACAAHTVLGPTSLVLSNRPTVGHVRPGFSPRPDRRR